MMLYCFKQHIEKRSRIFFLKKVCVCVYVCTYVMKKALHVSDIINF